MGDEAQLRIGELARRTGVATELLRAWERRYGLLAPTRTAAGYRLYSLADVRRVFRMRELLATGLSAAEAAPQAMTEPEPTTAVASAVAPQQLREALERFDDTAANAAFDQLLAELSLNAVLEHTVMPLLQELGEQWAAGTTSVAQEHFASNVVRGRLLGLARGWDRGTGPRAVLACPPGELHDLGLLVFGLALREQGWRITFLGADTPLDTLAETVRSLRPAALVIATLDPAGLASAEQTLRDLTNETAVWIGGAGADENAAARSDAHLLDLPPLAAAARLATAAIGD